MTPAESIIPPNQTTSLVRSFPDSPFPSGEGGRGVRSATGPPLWYRYSTRRLAGYRIPTASRSTSRPRGSLVATVTKQIVATAAPTRKAYS